MNQYKKELSAFLHSRVFMVCVILVTALSFGFAMTNVTISIDDLEGERYTGSGNDMLRAGRFGTFLWTRLTGAWDHAFLIDALSLAMMIFAVINWCILFRRVTDHAVSMEACTVFSCVFVSYPLMNEVWEYTGTNRIICGGYLLLSIALLLVYEQIHEGQWKKPWRLILASLLMMLVCASYESVVAVYIFFVFAILALQIVYGTEKEKTLWEVLRQGMIYASVLVAGLILRVVVHQIILAVMDLEAKTNGATKILWGTMPAGQILKNLALDWIRDYVFKGIIYFPLTELCVAAVVLLVIGVFACKKHGLVLLVPGAGMFLSLVILSLIQGEVSPYRTCQVFAAFVAFVAMLVANWACGRGGKLRVGVLVLCGWLCFQQASCLNYFLTMNHVRSEEEAYVIRDIGTDLESSFDMSKPVIFIGGYTLSDSTLEAVAVDEDSTAWKLYQNVYAFTYQMMGEEYDVSQLSRELPQSNVNSVIQWGTHAYRQQGMQNLFAYYGFDYVLADVVAIRDEANAYAQSIGMPAYPKDGYIQDAGEYIIIRIE